MNFMDFLKAGFESQTTFKTYFLKAAGFLTVFYGVLAFFVHKSISEVTWPTKQESCTFEKRHTYSIIRLWLSCSFLLTFMSILTIFVEYKLEFFNYKMNMRQYVVYACRNALKRFYATNEHAKTYAKVGLKDKLSARLADSDKTETKADESTDDHDKSEEEKEKERKEKR